MPDRWITKMNTNNPDPEFPQDTNKLEGWKATQADALNTELRENNLFHMQVTADEGCDWRPAFRALTDAGRAALTECQKERDDWKERCQQAWGQAELKRGPVTEAEIDSD